MLDNNVNKIQIKIKLAYLLPIRQSHLIKENSLYCVVLNYCLLLSFALFTNSNRHHCAHHTSSAFPCTHSITVPTAQTVSTSYSSANALVLYSPFRTL